ncbi:MAG: hypothetical protein WDM76_01460 [Limisphaerales bacterium]
MKLRGGRAFRQLRDGDEVEQNWDACREETKSQQYAGNTGQVFFHEWFGFLV